MLRSTDGSNGEYRLSRGRPISAGPARDVPERHGEILYYYLLISVALWIARLVLELLYPIKLRMFGIEPFTAIVAPGVAVEVALLLVAALHARRLSC